MRHIVSARERKAIVKYAKRGATANQIAQMLTINLDRVETFMPKDPEVEKKEAAERAARRAATRAREDADPNKIVLNAAKKKKVMEDAAAEILAQAAASTEVEANGPDQ